MLSVLQFCFLVNMPSVLSSFGCKLSYNLLRDSRYQIFCFNMGYFSQKARWDTFTINTINNASVKVIGRLDATLFGSQEPCKAVLKEMHRIIGFSEETGDRVCMITNVCHELNPVFN